MTVQNSNFIPMKIIPHFIILAFFVLFACKKSEEDRRNVVLQIKNESTQTATIKLCASLPFGPMNTKLLYTDSIIFDVGSQQKFEKIWYKPKYISDTHEGFMDIIVNKDTLYGVLTVYGEKLIQNTIDLSIKQDTVIMHKPDLSVLLKKWHKYQH